MSRAVLRTQLAGVARRPSRLLLTGLAMLVASFVVYSVVLAYRIAGNTVVDGVKTPAAGVVVEGDLPVSLLPKLDAVPGVAGHAARMSGSVQLAGGYLDVTADPGAGPLADVTVTQGRYPKADGEIAVTPRTAERLGLPIGAKAKGLTVVGMVDAPADWGQNAYSTERTVTGLLGAETFGRADLRLDPGTTQSDAKQAVALIAGRDATVLTGDEYHAREVESALNGARNVLLVVSVFVLIAVVAAVLVAICTFRIVFAQRMRQLALLRAVGAGRRSISRALAVEGAVTGLVTGGVGVLAALVLGQVAAPIAAAFDVQISGPGFPVGEGVAVIAMAVFLTLVAVLSPARSAARVSPLEALRSAGTTGARRDIGAGRWVLGILLVLGSAALAALVFSLLPTPETENYDPLVPLFATVGSASLAFFALATLGPVLVRPFLAVVGWPLRRLGPLGRLAVGGVGGAPRRAAAVSVVVALGVSLIGGTLVAGASLRTVLEQQVALEAPADFQVLADDAKLPAAVVNAARARAELTHVAFFRTSSQLTVNGQEAGFEASDIDPAALPRLGDVKPVGPGQIAVAGWAAGYLGVREGDRITVRLKDRTADVTVAALLEPSAPMGLSALMNPADMTRLGVPATPTRMVADAAAEGEAGRAAGVKALREVLAAQPGLGVDVLADRRDELDKAFTLVLAAGVALIGLTVLVAVVGVGSTSALSVVERTRESGLLRAVGLSRAGLRAMLTAESSLYGVIGAGFGLAIGVPYAWLAVRTMGLNAPLEFPAGQLAAVFLALVAFTALAGVLPARRAAKVSPVAALAAD
ncbi:ABC transporter permease [Actinoplanes sp. LDG1-06]|uniref:ABC transporter permease n=1 Tax=Paractinoplanes ovalisporus TaxID=2810368 RepID=A0ABS2AM41_9ACTN|nr:FtsX-like permease family protein [Actinoplanes ovalisporus]MBM2620851.1 ABC transporter permease [Actinoplanes ovalisporus]